MPARVIMVQGTMSSVGKSLLVAALCRIFRQDGQRVAPFKAQNMALNSFVTADGLEIGRAQAMQAEAAGVDVTVEMNPVLLKPEADSISQIVVLGRPWQRLRAREYWARRSELWSVVTGALDALRERFDLVVIEGAGSPAELNLKRGDLVNMAVARYAGAPVLLVGDIDRGGVFAQLLGTLDLLEPEERALVRGLVVNKFRGDLALFQDGVAILEARGGVPVLGVVPFVRDLRVADEDSVALDAPAAPPAPGQTLEIAVLRLPRISNFDDFDPLRAEPDVALRFVDRPEDLGAPDLLIIPGTKTTVADLAWLRERGLAERAVALARAGTPLLGICGGYQMLGERICDPQGVESDAPVVPGLGLLPVETVFAAEKQTVRARGAVCADRGLFAGCAGLPLVGYEIHMGRSTPSGPAAPLLHLSSPADARDGALSPDGWVAGAYLHGLFDNDALRHRLLANLAARRGLPPRNASARHDRAAAYDRLADAVRSSLDMQALRRIAGLE
ncbi:MAG TPA: cobyric acid synthase [Roseiflexaceae bacterium]|nr:cobyric acid synthase [Roseiflexaceae bacterium]